MALGEPPVMYHRAHAVGEPQEADRVGNGGSVPPNEACHLGLAYPEFIDQALVASGLFDGG